MARREGTAPELSIVIPAYNEETTVAGVVDGHREVGRHLAGTIEILVCDDGSTDGTGPRSPRLARAPRSSRSCATRRISVSRRR
ncbi:MAG: glycosyltransferase [Chloroflexi bacterium]|nr:MAG: glycosyltransferase [Chloroflexota bacterium]